ncbi:MAG: hypothetical protein L0Y71_21950 [Gemmataceae bacterium]|nr:hypothetical protein [Gemmataceae bacterium]
MQQKTSDNVPGVFGIEAFRMFVELCQLPEVGFPIGHVKNELAKGLPLPNGIIELLVLPKYLVKQLDEPLTLATRS